MLCEILADGTRVCEFNLFLSVFWIVMFVGMYLGTLMIKEVVDKS